MTRPRPYGSLAFRLLVLAAVPYIGLTMLAVQRIRVEQADRRHAEALIEIVQLRQAVVSAYAPKQVERIALEGMSRIDELGLPRPLVIAATGVDFEQLERDNHSAFDSALDDLAARFGTIVLQDGADLDHRLADVRGDLDLVHLAVDAGDGDVLQVRDVFDRLDATLTEVLSLERTLDGDPDEGPIDLESHEQQRLEALTAVVDSAGGRGKYLLRSILDDDPNRVWNAVAADGRQTAMIDQYRALLDAGEQTDFDAVTADLRPLRPELLSQMRDFSLTSFDTDLIAAAVSMLLDHGEYLVSLDSYAHDTHAEMEREAIAAADMAEANLHRTWLLLFSIGAITLGLIAFGSFATLAPLRRLTRRAEAIRAGNVDAEPLPIRGPSDVRSLTRTTNEMIAVLGQVDSEVRRLADGVVDDGYEVDLPGALGDSLQGSMNRLHDITRQLHRSEQMASAIVAGAADAIWTVDAGGRIVSANDASSALVGVGPREQQGQPILDYLSGISGEATVRSAAGSEWSVLVSTSTIEGADETVSVVIAHDISERLDFERQLAMQARRDPLTGLPNRLAVIERIGDLAAQNARAAVLYIDLDGFKSVNDLRGHSVGDDVLAEVGRRLRSTVGATDLVGRLGGDEFIVVSTSLLEADDIDDLGSRVIGVVEQPFTSEDLINLSASIGVVILDGHTEAESVLSEADSALYQAKHRGKGRLEVFDRTLQEEVAHQTELELALRRAIPNGELVLHLQPMIDVRSNRIDGAEALVRWNRPGHGQVPPNDFIPLAERSSLIIELDRWVIQQCCDRLADWRRRHVDAHVRLAVNISGRHLMEGNLVADVDAALTRSGADPSMLEIELTETHLLGDLERAVASLKALRERGVRVSIDDFGTGYSAMNYLRKLPIDAIKIDRSFVDAATSSSADASVVDAVMAIGRSHGLEVVAEGIETEEHLAFVRERGCNRAQGFLIARPMPADDAEHLLFLDAAIGAR